MHVHKIHRKKHQQFLSEGRSDPITGEAINAGDRVVFCKVCKSAFLRESWKYLNGFHCMQQETLRDFPVSRKMALKSAELVLQSVLFEKRVPEISFPDLYFVITFFNCIALALSAGMIVLEDSLLACIFAFFFLIVLLGGKPLIRWGTNLFLSLNKRFSTIAIYENGLLLNMKSNLLEQDKQFSFREIEQIILRQKKVIAKDKFDNFLQVELKSGETYQIPLPQHRRKIADCITALKWASSAVKVKLYLKQEIYIQYAHSVDQAHKSRFRMGQEERFLIVEES